MDGETGPSTEKLSWRHCWIDLVCVANKSEKIKENSQDLMNRNDFLKKKNEELGIISVKLPEISSVRNWETGKNGEHWRNGSWRKRW